MRKQSSWRPEYASFREKALLKPTEHSQQRRTYREDKPILGQSRCFKFEVAVSQLKNTKAAELSSKYSTHFHAEYGLVIALQPIENYVYKSNPYKASFNVLHEG